jgi:ABC-type transport system substrate-binding protein
VRKALLHALDRGELAEAAFPGAAIVPDSTAFPGTELHRAVDTRVVKYAHDAGLAARMLAEMGWSRGGDGTLAKGSDRFVVEVGGSPTGHAADVFPVLQQQLKQIGVDSTFKPVERDRQAQVSFRSFQNTGHLVNSVRATPALLSSQIPTPENRFGGANDGGYTNPAYDQAVAALNRALRPADYYRAWGDLYQIVSEDLPMLPLYFIVQPNAVRRGVSGALPTHPIGHGAYRIHEWDVTRSRG